MRSSVRSRLAPPYFQALANTPLANLVTLCHTKFRQARRELPQNLPVAAEIEGDKYNPNYLGRLMENDDLKFMNEAIAWADDCQPIKESIPKVGAIIASGGRTLGRGRRGTGKEGDDNHAEWHAIDGVKDKSLLPKATLYTTLEPCTRDVRSKPLECCTELILQHQIKKVFVGILDPNQGVTGKGLWRLQDTGVEVVLFPHDLSMKIRVQNAAFLRSQQTLGATIVTPKDGDELRTYDSAGKHTIQFECRNPPGAGTYLVIYRGGQYWPQPGPFRQIEPRVWEIDAHFGTTGEHFLQLVTADDLGSALIRYYRKVVELNRSRREKMRDKINDLSILGGDYPGIEMNGLPKGLRLEASVKVVVSYKINLIATSVEPTIISREKSLKITYEIECSENVAKDVAGGIWLGASFRDQTEKLFFNTNEDKAIALTKGKNLYDRNFTIAKDAPLGKQMLATNVWRGIVGDSRKSKWLAGLPPIAINIVE
jgi:pyrimidine deaminase RibD-like protein